MNFADLPHLAALLRVVKESRAEMRAHMDQAKKARDPQPFIRQAVAAAANVGKAAGRLADGMNKMPATAWRSPEPDRGRDIDIDLIYAMLEEPARVAREERMAHALELARSSDIPADKLFRRDDVGGIVFAPSGAQVSLLEFFEIQEALGVLTEGNRLDLAQLRRHEGEFRNR